MKIRIGCVDSQTYETDDFDTRVVQDEIDQKNGYIFDGDLSDKRVASVEEAVEELVNFLKYDKNLRTQTFNMRIKGRQRYFNVCHVVWWEIVK